MGEQCQDKHLSIKNCIEIAQMNKRSQACKQLQHLINSHHHLSSTEMLIDYVHQAISRAKALGECEPDDDNYPDNLCTSVYKLLETLLKQKFEDGKGYFDNLYSPEKQEMVSKKKLPLGL